MIQLQAGYISQAIIEDFCKLKNGDKFKKLFNYLSYFDIDTNDDFGAKPTDPIAVVVDKMISRGLPTYPSSFVEDIISNTFLKIRKSTEGGFFKYSFVNDELKEEIIRSFYIIEPRIKLENFGLLPENKVLSGFFSEFIPQNIGEYMLQLFSEQRTFYDIIKKEVAEKNYNSPLLNTELQWTVQFPYEINANRGITLEFTTEKDYLNSDQIKKQNLLEFLDQSGWKTNVLITDSGLWDSEAQKVINATFDDFFDNLRKNFKSPLYSDEYGLIAIQIALSPLAIARIQKTILHQIHRGKLNLNAKQWKIAIIERDVPAAFLAIEDLKQIFNNLFALENKNRKFPKVDLTIYNTPEFQDAELNILYQGKIYLLEDFDKNEKYDLLIDLSMLLRSSADFPDVQSAAQNIIKIRSAQYINSERKFYTQEKIDYNFNNTVFFNDKNNTKKSKDKKLVESLSYFARNIFRKTRLSSRQLRFISNLISKKNSLNVIPPKEDKYFLYQFSAMFQPGISIIVTPLMSTLKWQFDAFKKYAMDSASYFSAYTNKVKDKKQALENLSNSKIAFTYITPDRLHISEYRNSIKTAIENEVWFSNIIIDEAHCASEWSHDFRSLYASIYNNIKIIFGDTKLPSIKCLTETASYDVIEDLKLKYDILSENVIKIDPIVPNVNIEILKYNYQYVENSNTEDDVSQIKIDLIKERIKKNTVCITSNPTKFYSYFENQGASIFKGTIGDRLKTISTIKSKKSYTNIKDFQTKKTDYLFGTFTLGFGIRYNAQNVIFADLPYSTELFFQTLIRFYPDLKNIYLLNTEDKIYNTVNELDFDETSKLLEKQYSAEVPVEEVFRLKYFEKLYFSTKKNYNILKELTSQITYPTETIEQILTRRIRYAFDIWVRIESQPEKNPTKLYLYDNLDEQLGYIDYEKNQINITAYASKEEIANQILNFIKYDIEKIVSDGIEIFQILKDKISFPPAIGLNQIWSSMKKNEKSSLTVEFYNDSVSKLITELKENYNQDFSINKVIEIYDKSLDQDIFLENFNKILNHGKFQDKVLNKKIQDLYWNFRNFFDTLEAIYRIYSIGILDDYIIDYQNQQFILIFKKISDTDLLNHIYKYISHFTSKSIAFKVFEEIPKSEGQTIVEKVLNFFEKFRYKYIYNKRIRSYDLLQQAINKYSDSPENIINIVNHYFSEKYLIEMSALDSVDIFDILNKYFDESLLTKDEMMHIHRSSQIVLNTETNDNISVICGLSGLLINKNDEDIVLSSDILVNGLSNLRNNEALNFEKLINKIFEIIKSYNFELQSNVESLFFIKLHSKWLEKLNKLISNI